MPQTRLTAHSTIAIIAEEIDMKLCSPSVRRWSVVLCGGALATLSGVTALASSGYATDSRGSVVTSGVGECVQTSEWSQAGHTPGCDPAQAAEKDTTAMAAVEPVAAPVALISISDKRNVMFAFDSDVLTPAAIQEMGGVVGRIRDLEDVSAIRIVGHTDSVGSEAYNQQLSERRAESVRQFLESRGISATLLSASGEGELNPVADNASAEGRAMNRRVDIAISGKAPE